MPRRSNGQEAVLGTAFMLIGENSRTVSKAVAAKLAESEPDAAGRAYTPRPVYDRTVLVNKTIDTVQKNLLEGACSSWPCCSCCWAMCAPRCSPRW